MHSVHVRGETKGPPQGAHGEEAQHKNEHGFYHVFQPLLANGGAQ